MDSRSIEFPIGLWVGSSGVSPDAWHMTVTHFNQEALQAHLTDTHWFDYLLDQSWSWQNKRTNSSWKQPPAATNKIQESSTSTSDLVLLWFLPIIVSIRKPDLINSDQPYNVNTWPAHVIFPHQKICRLESSSSMSSRVISASLRALLSHHLQHEICWIHWHLNSMAFWGHKQGTGIERHSPHFAAIIGHNPHHMERITLLSNIQQWEQQTLSMRLHPKWPM